MKKRIILLVLLFPVVINRIPPAREYDFRISVYIQPEQAAVEKVSAFGGFAQRQSNPVCFRVCSRNLYLFAGYKQSSGRFETNDFNRLITPTPNKTKK